MTPLTSRIIHTPRVKRFLLASVLALLSVAPDFRLFDQNDHLVRLSAARGHKVVLVFYRGFW